MNDRRRDGALDGTIIMCKNIAERIAGINTHKEELPVSYSKNLLDPGLTTARS